MKTVTSIEIKTDEIVAGYIGPNDDDEWLSFEDEETCEKLEATPGGVKLLAESARELARDIRDNVGSDLRDIWERLDDLEERLEALEDGG